MGPIDYLVVLIIVLIIGGAAFYIYKAKKSGQKCVGCPHSKTCSSGGCSGCGGSCGCGTEDKKEN